MHNIIVGMILNNLDSPNILHTYGTLRENYFCDDSANFIALKDYLPTCNDQEFIHVLLQLLHIIILLTEMYTVVAINFLTGFGVQKVDSECPLELCNGRVLKTETIVKFLNFSDLSLRTADAQYLNTTGYNTTVDNAFHQVLQLYPEFTDKLPQNYRNALNFLNREKCLLPRRNLFEKINLTSHDTRFFCSQGTTNTYLELDRVIAIYDRDRSLFRERISNVLKQEAKTIYKKTKRIDHFLKKAKLTIEEADEPDIGIGSGAYEKKIINHIINWNIYRDISHWYTKVREFMFSVPKIEKIGNKLSKLTAKFTLMLLIIERHKDSIRYNPLFDSYFDAYRLFDMEL